MRKPITQLSRRDQAALGNFFGVGATKFERSTMGPMLDHIELFGFGAVKCGACRGAGIRWTSGAWCTKCGGSGSIPYELDRSHAVDELPVNETRTGSGGYVPDDAEMTRYAIISRRLSLLSGRVQQTLEAYYGDHGCRCDDIQAWRMVAVYPLVPAGERLTRLGADEEADADVRERYRTMPRYERAYWQVALERINSKPQRASLIRAAEEQATALYLEAVEAWEGSRPQEDTHAA